MVDVVRFRPPSVPMEDPAGNLARSTAPPPQKWLYIYTVRRDLINDPLRDAHRAFSAIVTHELKQGSFAVDRRRPFKHSLKTATRDRLF